MNAMNQRTATHPHLKTTHKNVAWTLAAIHEMLEESIYHCETLCHTLQAHHNLKAAKVFEELCPHIVSEQTLMQESSVAIPLPEIPPWEIPYHDYIHPVSALTHAHYLMSESDAWKLMSDIVQVHSCFYSYLLEQQQPPEIETLLKQLRQLNTECQKICRQHQAAHDVLPADLDPPIPQS